MLLSWRSVSYSRSSTVGLLMTSLCPKEGISRPNLLPSAVRLHEDSNEGKGPLHLMFPWEPENGEYQTAPLTLPHLLLDLNGTPSSRWLKRHCASSVTRTWGPTSISLILFVVLVFFYVISQLSKQCRIQNLAQGLLLPPKKCIMFLLEPSFSTEKIVGK